MSKPTSYEPVNTMPSMSGFSWSSAPTVLPGPMTRLNTPSGTPASRYASAGSRSPVIADADAGLNTTVLPAIIAADVGPTERAIGKLNGLMTANTPCGRRIDRVWTAGSPRLSISWS